MAETQADHEPGRRDFLFVATAATGVVGLGATIWPLIDQMNPDASVRALASIDVSVADLEEGSEMIVKWRGKPVIIRHRTQAEIDEANAVDVASLPDADANNPNIGAAPATDENRSLGGRQQFLVQMGVCTHLGCVPIGDGAGDFNGWYCPCHGSHYDSAGRIRRGPAPRNLPVPPAQYLDDTTIQLG